jgi:inosine-uridine nucleoside N-ribohydrolase
LDVDPGIDDAIAIITALRSNNIEVIGIATVYGNVSPKIGMLNTLKVLGSIDRADVPVIEGAKRPLIKRLLPHRIKKIKELSHGKWGLGNIHVNHFIIRESLVKRREKNKVAPTTTSYLDFIDEIIKYYRADEISIIASGPLTNIAQAIMYKPEFIDKVSQISIMGGAFGLANNIKGNITKFAEFNFYCYPESEKTVLSLPDLNSKIKIAGLDITQHPKCSLNNEFMDKIHRYVKNSSTTESQFILSLLDFKLSRSSIFHLHDVLAVLMIERPSYFSFKRGNVDVMLKGKLRGQSKFMKDEVSGSIQVAADINGLEFKNFLFRRLLSQNESSPID